MHRASASEPPTDQFDISVIISTYNRCNILRGAIASLLAQVSDGVTYEVIIVDNNSTDRTRQTVESFIERGATNLRYIFEPKQGVSYGRNAGIQASRAPIIALTDDDVQTTPKWVATIKRLFDEHPEVVFLGGKVLPLAPDQLPRWVTRDHWEPLAILDYGDTPFYVDASRRLCLLTASLAFRREVFAEVGLFSPELQRVKDGIGSLEDLELQLRVWRAGRQGLYTPELQVGTEVPPTRLTRSYHRRWHKGHGRFYAVLRDEEIEQSRVGRLFDVPAHLYRQALADATGWLKSSVMGKRDEAFKHETRLCFFAGFFGKRRQDRSQKAIN
jgi:glycosyltransferase involved in cell wall biosynthesis